ncbi:MAG: alpha/beta fold hydrolase [Deltaproteobacteria bacterium]|nr:alpha/beta fold hydrolase [Deltaproteobacteria bacterium]
MANFVLVHGSWHGAWCWDHLRPRLEDHGHRLVVPDLPAHGDDPSSPWRVSLADYSAAVRRAASSASEPVVAVGHSMGGMAISQAVADAPELFCAAVYLCAFAPLPGDRISSLARRDQETLLPSAVRLGTGGVSIRREKAAELFYADCQQDLAEWATSRLRPDPYRPLLNRFQYAGSIQIPRAYIECTADQAISLNRQREMAARAGIEIIASLQTSHSPFLSRPDELADHLNGFVHTVAS